MLPCAYFHVTVTVPEELRDALRANQRDGYALLMKAAADAIVELARDRRYVGATVGVLAVLHTWTQQLIYHPHVHCLVTGGGVSDDDCWHPARKAFLALQLQFEMSAPCFGLVCSSPERPSDDELWVDLLACKTRGDAADFLHRPADQRLSWLGRYVVVWRRILFGGGETAFA
jgi:hypothetical protein